ncbi:MAG: HD-GYP domain-containing protein [Chloroflexi bacterium]|nr:HD-GYP domain-containing protein [Chloroflexota bacterium]
MIRRARPARYVFLGIWPAGLLVPVAVFLWLLLNPQLDPVVPAPLFHFVVVSFAGLLGLIISLLIARTSAQLQDERVFFLTLGFVSITGIFLVHGLTTPGAIVQGASPGVGWSPRLALFVGALAFVASTFSAPGRWSAWLVRHQTAVFATFLLSLAIYGGVVLVFAEQLVPVDRTVTPIVRVVPWLTLALFGVAISRYFQAFRLSRLPMQGALVVGLVFFAQSQLSMAIGTVWRLSWWEYHGLMLAGFLAVLYGLGLEYSRGDRTLAGIIEGLFLRDTYQRIARGFTEAMTALVAAIEARDPYTRGHSARVAELSVAIGQHLRLSPETLRKLGQAALLHDIGKLGIADSILHKTAALSPEEMEEIRAHTIRGDAIVGQVESLRELTPGIRHHHEWMNGTGYPDGLSGEKIPVEARIIAVADVYDALTSARAYRPAMTRREALDVIYRESGPHLDPACVEALARALGETVPWRPGVQAVAPTVSLAGDFDPASR